jgi:hypothetical protein
VPFEQRRRCAVQLRGSRAALGAGPQVIENRSFIFFAKKSKIP